MLPHRRFFAFLLAALLLAGCAGSKEAAVIDDMMATPAAPPVHPLAGAWDYSIDTPQGIFEGILTFTEADGMLNGTIAQSAQPDQTAPITELMFDKETSKLTGKFDSGEYGIMLINLTLDGDALSGVMNVTQFGVDVPMKGSRKMME